MGENEELEGITLFAAVKTFYENGNDILSAVCSLALVTIVDGESVLNAKMHFEEKYTVSMPTSMMHTILRRLRKNGLISYGAALSNIILTEHGRIESERLNSSVNNLRRDFTALVAELNSFFDSRNYEKPSKPDKALLDFIDQNLGFASQAMTSTANKKEIKDTTHIAEYIVHIEKNEPSLFVLLQNIFFGRLYLSIIKTRTDFSSNVKMEPTKVYLDTSIVLNLLGLDGSEELERSKELLGILLAAKNIQVGVFSESLDEATRLLQTYMSEFQDFTPNIKVGSIFYELKRQGYDRYRIGLLIESLEEKVQALGITIEHLPSITDDKAYASLSSDLSTWAELLENPKNQNALEHDAKILHFLKTVRKNTHSKLFEKCQAIFISPDRAIHELCQEMSIKNNSFPLAIFPLDAVAILWMRDIGNAEIATNVMRQSVMAFVREKAISLNLWDTFLVALKEAASHSKLSKEDVAMILASDDVSRLLAEQQYDAPEQIIDEGFIQKLRDQRSSLKKASIVNGRAIKGVKGKISAFSERFAKVSAVTILCLACLGLSWVVYEVASRTGIDRLASIIAIAAVAIPILASTITGKEIKVARVVIKIRTWLHSRIYAIVKPRLESYFISDTEGLATPE